MPWLTRSGKTLEDLDLGGALQLSSPCNNNAMGLLEKAATSGLKA
jgi:hypothetical protein